eukprot:SAG31_NODE_123_length_23712_cov_41.426291_20_plen_130_part_00
MSRNYKIYPGTCISASRHANPTPYEASRSDSGRRLQPARQCKGKHQVSPGGNWFGGVSRYADRSSVIKAVADSLNESERAAIAIADSGGKNAWLPPAVDAQVQAEELRRCHLERRGGCDQGVEKRGGAS